MKVAFYSPHLCLRGTTVAMFDYAYYNQTILNNESIIFYEKNHLNNDISTIKKFSIFKCIQLNNFNELEDQLEKNRCDSVYIIKGGWKDDGRNINVCKSLIHAIGMAPASEQHGSVYAYGSYWLAKVCSNNTIPAVPYMVDLPNTDEDFRYLLNIPKEAFVFGRNGGLDTWNLPYANKVLFDVLEKRDDIYFVFQNTPINFTHRRIIHLPSTSDMLFKTKFINTCDAMIHARNEGESFGLSCAEFSIRNKPIITWIGSRERNHIETLGEKGIYYNNEIELFNKICNFVKQPDKDWNCYRQYAPEKIINIFKKVYLDG